MHPNNAANYLGAARKGCPKCFFDPLKGAYGYRDIYTPVENREAAIKLLKKKGRLEQYEKNKEVYEQLKPLQEAAIDRAKKRVAVLQAEHTEILSRESNPVTTVAEMVEYLNNKQ